MIKDTIRAIFERKSVRNYTGEKVSNEKLELLVKAGMAAPSAVNYQPWSFIIVTDETILKQLAEGLPYAKMLPQAGSAIIVCGIPKAAYEGRPEMWIQDCSAATENILLAAEALGLGAVWTALYPYHDRLNTAKNILNIPETVEPLCAIAIGYPTDKDKPKNKFKPENIHYNTWE